MPWEVEFTDQFEDWFAGLEATEQDRIAQSVIVLEQRGPGLGRPLVDSLVGSAIQNLKELRIGTVRILFVFDPRRVAILLLGGDKREQWRAWYAEAIPEAEHLYAEHLREIEGENA